MIVIPKKKCNSINCNNLIDFRNKYCDEHKHLNNEYDKQRYKYDKEVRQTYNSQRWRTIRKQCLIRDNGLCMYCLHNGLYTQATLVDHFIPVRDSHEDRYNMNNLVSACVKCNTRKAVDEDKLRSDQMTLNGFKSNWNYIL